MYLCCGIFVKKVGCLIVWSMTWQSQPQLSLFMGPDPSPPSRSGSFPQLKKMGCAPTPFCNHSSLFVSIFETSYLQKKEK